MGNTFTGATIVPTGSANLESDSIMPSFGALSLGGIAGGGALPSTSGVDCKLVHGRRDQRIEGDMHEQINGRLETTIDQDETHTVKGNQKVTVKGIVYLTVVSGWQEEQDGPVNRHYRQVATDLFDQDHHSHVPESWDFTVSQFANTLIHSTQIGICTGIAAAISTGLSLTAANLDLEGKMLHAEGHGLHFAWQGNKEETKESEEDLSVVKLVLYDEIAIRDSVNMGLDLDLGCPFT
jgi:hypothetical protein